MLTDQEKIVALAEARQVEQELKTSIVIKKMRIAMQAQYDDAVAALPNADATDAPQIIALQNQMRLKLIFDALIAKIEAVAAEIRDGIDAAERPPHPD